MSITFRKDRNRWIASRTVDGKRVQITCESKREAKEVDEALREKQLNCVGIHLRYPIKEAFASYLETDSAQKTESTQKSDRKFLEVAEHFFCFSLCLRELKQIKIEHLQLFQLYMSRDLKLSYTTISLRLTVLRSVFKKAFVHGRIPSDPCEHWKVPRGTHVQRRAMTQSEFNQLRRQSMPDWLRPVLEFIRFTGARGASVASLRWSDVEFSKLRLYLSSRKGKLRHVQRTPFPLYEGLNAFLSHHQSSSSGEYVFTDDDGRPLTGHRISSAAHRAIKTAGLEGVVLYSLRHALAVDLTESGVSIEITRQLMGHSNISQTQNYAKGVSSDSLSDSVKLIRAREVTQQDVAVSENVTDCKEDKSQK